MIIGLVRHYPVKQIAKRKWMTASQFDEWVREYDEADIEPPTEIGHGQDWDVCYCSDLPRAARTAEILYDGPIRPTDQLREIGIRSIGWFRLKLHYGLWLLLARAAWMRTHKSQPESPAACRLRASRFVDWLEERHPESARVLVVSHGAFMRTLSLELKRRGFRGRGFWKPANGRLYTYRRKP